MVLFNLKILTEDVPGWNCWCTRHLIPLVFAITSQLAVLEISCLACMNSHLAALDNLCLWHLTLEFSLRKTSHAYGIQNFKSRCARYLMPIAFGTATIIWRHHCTQRPILTINTNFKVNRSILANNPKPLMAVKMSIFEKKMRSPLDSATHFHYEYQFSSKLEHFGE